MMAGSGLSPTKILHQCAWCRFGFYPKRTDRTTFCSRECAFAAKSDEAIRGSAAIHRPKVVTLHRRCSECGNAFTATPHQRICSDECRKNAANKAAKRHNVKLHQGKTCACKQCGATFNPEYGSKRRSYCTAECARKAQRKHQVRGTNRKRARAFGVEYQYVNPLKVLRRDNWTCQLCGRKTPQSLRGTYDDRAPEVDHILPISKGGPHIYANLQCACRACNIAKGDAQMGLITLFAV